MSLLAGILLVCFQKPTTDVCGLALIAFAIGNGLYSFWVTQRTKFCTKILMKSLEPVSKFPDLNHRTYYMLGAGFLWMSLWILAVIGAILPQGNAIQYSVLLPKDTDQESWKCMPWFTLCVSCYYVCYTKNPENRLFDKTIPDRLSSIKSGRDFVAPTPRVPRRFTRQTPRDWRLNIEEKAIIHVQLTPYSYPFFSM